MSKALRLLTLLATAGAVVLSALATPAQAAVTMCKGLSATIVSSEATITGTPGRDVIVVKGRDAHTINAGAGNDVICGSPGADTVNAGAGRDVVLGGAGADRIFGAGGADTINGGAGVDALMGGAGVDLLSAGSGTNFCAKDPADRIIGSCTIDAGAPTMAVAPASFTAQAGTTVTFTWSLTDPAGISRTGLKIGSASGWVTTWCGFAIEGNLISGNTLAGTYEASCYIPFTAVSQDYTAFFDATDIFGTGGGVMETQFTVVGGVADTVPPTITSIEVLPSAVAVGQDFVVRYTVTDESGVAGAIVWLASNGYGFADLSGRAYADMSNAPVLVAGDAKSGTYEIVIRMFEYAPKGDYSIWTSALDIYGNKAFEQTAVTFTVI